MSENLRIRVVTTSPDLAAELIPLSSKHFSFAGEPFNIELHGKLLHEWCNKPYSAKFWNMRGSYEELLTYYTNQIENGNSEFMVVTINNEPSAFAECYPIIGSELEQHIAEATEKDFGFHFLMAPPKELAKKYPKDKKTVQRLVVLNTLGYYFTLLDASNIYGEPDVENTKAIKLATKLGFHIEKDIKLTDKTASLIRFSKE